MEFPNYHKFPKTWNSLDLELVISDTELNASFHSRAYWKIWKEKKEVGFIEVTSTIAKVSKVFSNAVSIVVAIRFQDENGVVTSVSKEASIETEEKPLHGIILTFTKEVMKQYLKPK